MLIFFVVIILFILAIAFFKAKIHVDIGSFFRSSLPLLRGTFGVYCFTGKQGTGKTYSLVKFVKKNCQDKKLYSNVTLKGLDYTPLTSIEQLLNLRDEKDCYIVYDEVFTLMMKSTKIEGVLKEFITQQRKQHNIFLTTAQEWLDLPIEFRRFVRIQVACKTRPLGRLGGIITEQYYDATNMAWDNMANEYVAPLLTTKISKYEKRYMLSYDTEERIRPLALKSN